jgi:Pyruvate/2-oxoacid:ferredoxin oxidoreductase gamma subunit
MRSGTSNCHVRIAGQPIDSPMVTNPDILVAMNEPSLHKFCASVRPGGSIIYNGEDIPSGCKRDDVHLVARSFTQIAADLGNAKAANMVMLGVLLESTNVLPNASIDAALRRLINNPKWVELDERALSLGRNLFKESLAPQTETAITA